MVGAHVFNQFSPISVISGEAVGLFERISDLTGAFPGGAQCFMMIMGMLLFFSTKPLGKGLVRRGLALILFSFAVEVLRLLPGLVNFAITGDFVSFYPEHSHAEDWQLMVVTLFWQDILIFAGMALVFLGIVIEFNVPDKFVVIILASMMVSNTFLSGMDTGNDALDIFLGYFWGTTIFDGTMTTSRYPFLSWIVYPVAGYLIGNRLVRCTDKHLFYKRLGLIFFILSVPLTVIGVLTGMFDTGFTGLRSYHQGILVNLWCMLLAFDWIVLVYLVSLKVPERCLAHPIRWGRNVTRIYVLHFVILAIVIQFLPLTLDVFGCIVTFLVLFAVSDILASRFFSPDDGGVGDP